MLLSSFRRSSSNIICSKNFFLRETPTELLRQVSRLSTNLHQLSVENTIVLPPNLKIDPRTKASPFYGLERLSLGYKDDKALAKNTTTQSSATVKESLRDHTDGSGAIFSIENMKKPIFAIPLPQRLNVPIIHFATNEKSGTIHLSPEVFGQEPIRTDILHRCVIYQRNKFRGTRNGGARTKTISEVSGSGKKMRNQKGGGVARAGHKRPAHWRGGAKAHGPKGSIQNYETKLNKKVRKMGIRMALSQKLKEGNIILVDTFSDIGTYKTKVLSKKLHELAGVGGKEGKSGYIVDHVLDDVNDGSEDALATSLSGVDINLKVASGNIFRSKVTNQRNVNVYDLLKHEKLILSLSALQKLEERYGI